MPQKTVYGTATKENVNVAAVKLRKDNYIYIPRDIKDSLDEVKSTFDNLNPTCEGVNLSNTYDELKGIIKNLQGYDQVLKLKVEYGEDSDIKTGKDLLEALDPKIDPRAATFDETIRDLFSILYGAVRGHNEAIKEDS